MRRTPSFAGQVAGGIFGLGFLLFFCVISGAMAFFALASLRSGFGGAFGLCILIVPGLIFLAGLAMFLGLGRRLARFRSAPLERRLARVLDERIEVSGGEHASTSYFTTLEWEDRTRREVENHARLAGKLVRDDVGLAYLKGDLLLDFQRIDV